MSPLVLPPVPPPEDWLVFTDLDGTLLDHHDYSHRAAAGALQALGAAGVPVIPATSKTVAEWLSLRDRIGIAGPLVAENGAVTAACKDSLEAALVTGPGCQAVADLGVRCLGTPRDRIRAVLHELREAGASFESFSDLGAAGVARATGLAPEDAARACERLASEPLVWRGTEAEREEFLARLRGHRLRTVQGGRFLHVLGSVDKSVAMGHWVEFYAQRWARRPFVIALGDSPNDLDMLQAADLGVAVLAANGQHLRADPERPLWCVDQAGPAGWQAAFDTLFAAAKEPEHRV